MERNTIFRKGGIIITWALALWMTSPVFGQIMKGRVVSCRESNYYAREKFGKIVPGDKFDDEIIHDEEFTFDENGNVTEVVDYNADETVDCRYVARPDYQDNRMESLYIRFYPQNAIDQKPFLLESVNYSLGKVCKITYTDDEAGRPAEETISDLMGNVLNKATITRDQHGNPLEVRFSDETVYQFRYDNKGNRVKWISHSGGDTTVTSFQYDDQGNLVEQQKDNFFRSRYKFRYDRYNYQYRYDETGNWTARTEYHNGKPVRITLRDIKYAPEQIPTPATAYNRPFRKR